MTLSPEASRVLYKLQQSRGNALYVTANFGTPEDQRALAELETAGLALVQAVTTGAITRKQAKLTPTGRSMSVPNPWSRS